MNAEPSGAHLVRLRNATVEGGRQKLLVRDAAGLATLAEGEG